MICFTCSKALKYFFGLDWIGLDWLGLDQMLQCVAQIQSAREWSFGGIPLTVTTTVTEVSTGYRNEAEMWAA